ncbi:MAG: ThuA domain-containing protein [Gammaproteobacteria bacterium]|nr:ThuA domain-containing protein [Gammaproteobacteria bacterium]
MNRSCVSLLLCVSSIGMNAVSHAAQLSMEELAAVFRTEPDVEPIRVLTVTATHGFRHTPAIDAAKKVLGALNGTTEFSFDFTEDVDDFNRANLERYDLLFFANSTLRVDEPTQDAVGYEAALEFRPGDWRNFDAVLKTAERDIKGRIALSGRPGELSGMAEFGAGVSVIDEIAEEGDQLRLIWDAGSNTTVTAEVTLTDDGLTGHLKVGEQSLPLEGVVVDARQTENRDVQNPVTADHRAAIVDFLCTGVGIVGSHSSLDAFYGWGEYRRMVGGGLFESHPWTQRVRILIEDPDNPAVAHMGDELVIRDEIYVLDNNPRWNSHVLASLDTGSVGIEQGPADGSRNDYPISWLREHKGGRVFMTKLGHFPEVWTNPVFLQHLLQGMRMTAGRIPANFASRRIKETISENVWPDDIAVDEKGNVWIAELRGKIHRFDAETEKTTQIAHLETTDPTKLEHGLYGIEVDPNFYDGEPYVYLYYAERETFTNTLARYRYEDGRLNLNAGEVLLRVPTEPQCCHQAGDLEWGLDGTLFVSTGDTGMSETRPEWELSEESISVYKTAAGLKDYHWSRLVDSERSAQNLQDLRGKILRINKDGSLPTDNPFYGKPGVRWEIYAYGLRNPYRFKVHPTTGDLYIGVVGPDARYDYDEYDISTNGGENYGWPRSLGKLFYNDWAPEDIPNYVPPLWEYTYATGGRSATMGPIYQHTGKGAFPKIFQGKVFIFDWARRWIKWADVELGTFSNDAENDVRNTPLNVELPAYRFTNIRNFDQLTTTAPIAMELGPDGSLYLAEFDGFWDAGPNAKVTRYRWVTGSDVIDTFSNVTRSAMGSEALGQQIYDARCASCHQASGQGVSGVFPPLAGTRWVTGDESRLISLILDGVSGELEVNGIVYNGAMPPWANSLDDTQIAAVLTHIRSSWGNRARSVTADKVAGVRSR